VEIHGGGFSESVGECGGGENQIIIWTDVVCVVLCVCVCVMYHVHCSVSRPICNLFILNLIPYRVVTDSQLIMKIYNMYNFEGNIYTDN
jgi:hypothetical protein